MEGDKISLDAAESRRGSGNDYNFDALIEEMRPMTQELPLGKSQNGTGGSDGEEEKGRVRVIREIREDRCQRITTSTPRRELR